MGYKYSKFSIISKSLKNNIMAKAAPKAKPAKAEKKTKAIEKPAKATAH